MLPGPAVPNPWPKGTSGRTVAHAGLGFAGRPVADSNSTSKALLPAASGVEGRE